MFQINFKNFNLIPFIKANNKDNDDKYKINRANASTFVTDGVGYVVGGSTGSALNSTWRYEESQEPGYSSTILNVPPGSMLLVSPLMAKVMLPRVSTITL